MSSGLVLKVGDPTGPVGEAARGDYRLDDIRTTRLTPRSPSTDRRDGVVVVETQAGLRDLRSPGPTERKDL